MGEMKAKRIAIVFCLTNTQLFDKLQLLSKSETTKTDPWPTPQMRPGSTVKVYGLHHLTTSPASHLAFWRVDIYEKGNGLSHSHCARYNLLQVQLFPSTFSSLAVPMDRGQYFQPHHIGQTSTRRHNCSDPRCPYDQWWWKQSAHLSSHPEMLSPHPNIFWASVLQDYRASGPLAREDPCT